MSSNGLNVAQLMVANQVVPDYHVVFQYVMVLPNHE